VIPRLVLRVGEDGPEVGVVEALGEDLGEDVAVVDGDLEVLAFWPST